VAKDVEVVTQAHCLYTVDFGENTACNCSPVSSARHRRIGAGCISSCWAGWRSLHSRTEAHKQPADTTASRGPSRDIQCDVNVDIVASDGIPTRQRQRTVKLLVKTRKVNPSHGPLQERKIQDIDLAKIQSVKIPEISPDPPVPVQNFEATDRFSQAHQATCCNMKRPNKNIAIPVTRYLAIFVPLSLLWNDWK